VPVELLQKIPDLPLTTTSWWYGKAKSLWLSPVDDLSDLRLIEFTCRVYSEPFVPGKTVSWGVHVSNEKVSERFTVGSAGTRKTNFSQVDANILHGCRTAIQGWSKHLSKYRKVVGGSLPHTKEATYTVSLDGIGSLWSGTAAIHPLVNATGFQLIDVIY